MPKMKKLIIRAAIKHHGKLLQIHSRGAYKFRLCVKDVDNSMGVIHDFFHMRDVELIHIIS